MRGIQFGLGVFGKVATAASVLVLSLMMLAPGAGVSDHGASPNATTGTMLSGPTAPYGGRAYAVGIQDPLLGATYFADTGPLPSSGGVLITDFATISTQTVDALSWITYATGLNNTAQSEVATSDLTLFSGTAYQVGASFVYSTSSAACAGVSGAAQVFDLTIGGISYGVTGAPNQVLYSIPGVFTLIANEQIDSSSGSLESLTVNALHATLEGVDVIIASSSSSIDCGGLPGLGPMGTRSVGTGPSPMHAPPPDFTTGGGFFYANPALSTCPGDKVNFGFNAGPRPGDATVKGHLNAVDHGPDCDHHVEGNVQDYFRYSAEGFSDPQDVCRVWGGPATLDHVSGYWFWAVTCDYGEPGRYDRFHVEVWSNSDPGNHAVLYTVDNARGSCPADMPNCGDLPGGNIQLHRFG